MRFEGFLRSLQHDALLMGILLAAIAVAYVAALVAPIPSEIKKFAWIGAWVASAAVIAVFVGSAIVTAASNRTPRSDIDPDGVYQQMEAH